jgi:hypothetical protein
MVSVMLPPGATETVGVVGASVMPGAMLTVRAMVVEAVRLPEVPVTVIVAGPTTAALLAVSVSTLDAVAGLAAKLAETPLGKPVAAKVTLPVKPFAGAMLMFSVAVLPCVTASVAALGAMVKLGAALTVRAMVVDAVSAPEVPVIVIVASPVVAAAVAVKVSTLDAVAGLVAKLAVTPLGKPVAARVTLPVNPLAGVMVMLSDAEVPCVTASVTADGAIVKVAEGLMVRAMVVEAVSAPEVPVIVTVAVAGVAESLAVRVSTLDAVAGLVAKLAVTPAGRPVAASVTLPVNPFAGVTVTVSVALLPCVTDRAAAAGAMVKVGAGATVSAIVVEAVRLPEVPVTVTVTVPVVAVPAAVSVSTLVPVVGFVAKLDVTPLGRPVAASVTLPVNPLAGVMVMVSVPLAPWITVSVDVEGARVKLGAGFTVKLCCT